MLIIVPTPEPDCPAARALTQEAVPHQIKLCDTEYAYGQHIADTWRARVGFILIEWDIAPWPGAIQALWDCPHDYCYHQYPKHGAIGGTLGCAKFSEALVRDHAHFADRWGRVPWTWMDKAICLPLMNTIEAHCHQPPVAHVRRKEP